MNHLRRAVVYVAFALLVMVNFHAYSSSMFLYKGINHFLQQDAVVVQETQDRASGDAVPVLDRRGSPTGRTVEVLVHNSTYDVLRSLPVLNVQVVLVAFLAYGLLDAVSWWRRQQQA
ncbi:hypothetical protein [Xanthomonas sp. D-109]|uniref:hypothetical protein n=1 Tax=Xanthomonas sp. D-109 TaxID=2821274 RepID=UPI001ADAE5D2|nr:hypothetical protein [Xanthomonas sp. D-109]MBO9880998.1 hypothetical protein [Xanthomonas sp. D-109]